MFKWSGFRFLFAVALAAAGMMIALPVPQARAQEAQRVADWVEVEVGQSRVIRINKEYKRLELGDPDVAKAKPMDDLTYFSVLGLEVQGDGGLLFGMACGVLVAGLAVAWLHRGDLRWQPPE